MRLRLSAEGLATWFESTTQSFKFMFPQDQILGQIRRRRGLEPPFATPPIALQQEAEQSKSDPWSERLPDGRTVNEAIMGTLQRGQMPSIPTPQNRTPPIIPTPTDAPPPEVPAGMEPSPESATRPWKVGSARGESDPLKREAARIRAMIENPTSQVNPDGSVGVPEPMGRVKGALLGALFGLSQGGPDTSLAGRLSAGAAGAGVGAFKPRAVQEWRRRMEVDDAQGQLGQQVKLDTGQAQLENLRAETQSRMADLEMDPETGRMVKRQPRRAPQYVERSDGVYEISEANPNGRRVGNIPAEVKARSRGSVHYETREDGVYAIFADDDGQIKSQKVEGVPGKPSEREDKTIANQAKREAKLNESATYYKKAESLDSQAASLDEHIRKLEEGMKTIPEFAVSTSATTAAGDPIEVPNPGRKAHQDEIANLRKQQKDLRDEANRQRENGDKARSEGESVPAGNSTSQASGRKWSASKWAAANPGGDVEAAKAAARAAKYTVVE